MCVLAWLVRNGLSDLFWANRLDGAWGLSRGCKSDDDDDEDDLTANALLSGRVGFYYTPSPPLQTIPINVIFSV